jgi:hypothetical protein
MLRALLAAAEAVAAADDSARVTVEVWMPRREEGKEWLATSPVQVSARNGKGQEFRGLVMPLT